MTTKKTAHPTVEKALLLDGDPEKIKAFYAKWAESYDDDLVDRYTAPRIIVDLFLEYLSATNGGSADDRSRLVIADAGCGTGMVGSLLHGAGFRIIDGMDISADMVEQARKLGVYRELHGNIDLTQTLAAKWKGAYDAVLCCGVFTLGHVPPTLLQRLIEMSKPGGVLICSTRTAYYDDSDYQQVSDRLLQCGKASLLSCLRDGPYTNDGDAHYWVYRAAAGD